MTDLVGGEYVIEVLYIIAAALFILSLKWLSSPATARRGVFAGEIGMALAIIGTLFYKGIVDYKWIAIGLVLGTIAIVAATSNIVGGFIITDRMLKMFKASKAPKP